MTDKITVKLSAPSYKNVPRGKEMEYSNQDDFVFQALPWDHNEVGEIESVPVGDSDNHQGNRKNKKPFVQHNNEEGRDHTVFITGTTKDGNSVTVQTVFHPYFLIKLGGEEPGPEWTKNEIEDFIQREIFVEERYDERSGDTREVFRKYKTIANLETEEGLSLDEIKEEKFSKKKYVTYKSAFLGWESLRLKDLNAGFTVDKSKLPDIVPLDFQFIKVHFKTLTAMKACSFMLQSEDLKKRLAKSGTQISLYEANLDPYIRLMHLSKCEPSGWIVIPAGTYNFIPAGTEERQTTSMVEIVLNDWSNMRPPEKYINDMAPFRECSIDLETYSADDAKFSDSALTTDCILQIASTFSDFGSGKPAVKVLYNLHNCDPIDEPDTIVKCFDSERDMLLDWAELISNSDPDTVHAYNGWDFDFNYLITRAKINKCWDQFRTTLGRIKSLPSQHIEQHLSSAAYGDNHWVLLTMSGRIVFDPIVHLQREFKLKSYTLKSTSEYFLSVKLPKNPLSAVEGSRMVTIKHPKHGLAVNKVVHLSDVDLPDTETTDDGKKFYAWNGWNYEDLNETLFIIREVPSPNEYVIEMPTPAKKTDAAGGGGSVKAFETKHDVSFPDMNRAHRENNGAVMRDVGRYCIQDTMLPQKILDKLCVLPNLIEMSKVTWVPLDYLISRGQQVKVHSQVCKAAHETGYAVPTVVRPKKDETDVDNDDDGVEEEEGYVGGAVLDPDVGFYDQPISVPDFKSLYPTTMIDNNLCYTSHLKNPKYDNIPGVQYNRITVGSKIHTFAMNNDGIVPQILAYLLNTRDARKEMMANSKTDIERMIHNGAQLALKVSANSIYGFMGIPIDKAMLPCMPIAESTTARGRNGTFTTRDYMEDKTGANFEQIKKFDANTDGMPLDWVHLMKNTTKGKCFHLTGAKLLGAYGLTIEQLKDAPNGAVSISDPKNLKIWTTDEFTDIIGFSVMTKEGIDLLRVYAVSGSMFDMKNYKCRIVYGDSVTADTPVLIRRPDQTCSYVNIEDIPIKGQWEKKDDQSNGDAKEVATPIDGLMVWSDKGFTPVKRVIRHLTNKDIFRVATNTGCVKVTSDHSLLSPSGKEVRPSEVKVGDDLMCVDLPNVLLAPCSTSSMYCQLEAAKLMLLKASQGQRTRIELHGNLYCIRDVMGRLNETSIQTIENFGPTKEPVYDLETENHHFGAGVGKMIVHNTDSVFSMFDVNHLPESQPHRVAYCCVVAGYVASRVTKHLRSLNPFKPFNKQWMELQYEKTYRFWLLFSKKRYAGEMTEHDPFHFTDDQKGVASKRRDFCNYVKEIYGKILKSLFDPTPGMTRDQRIGNMLAVVKRAIEDLLNNRVPFDKLVISKLLKDHYKVLKHAQSKASKLCDFNPDNVFVNDLIKFRTGGVADFKGALCDGIVSGKQSTNLFSGERKKPLTVRIVNVKPIVVGQEIPVIFSPGMNLELQYGDITERNSSVITLDKIMDPKTTDKVLEPIKHPHVRLARRMFLRDPATAPKSGARVPYVFCETKANVLQHMRSEDPTYAKAHNLVVDPEYYLKKQCEKAWAQILDTTCTGISEKIFNEAYDAYSKKSTKQPDIMSFIAGSHVEKMKVIELTDAKGTNTSTTSTTAKATPQSAAKPISAYFGGSSVHPPVVKKNAVKAKAAPAKVPAKAVPITVKAKVQGSSKTVPMKKVAATQTPKRSQKEESKQAAP